VLAEASLWLRCTRSFTILSTARQPIAESSKPESITEGMEMSIHVNYELLTLLVTVLVSPLTSLPEGSLSEKAILGSVLKDITRFCIKRERGALFLTKTSIHLSKKPAT
jgi:hypothetical protein